jgi:hypothetical protein
MRPIIMRLCVCLCMRACFKEMQSMTIKEMQSMTLRNSTITSKMQKQTYKRTNKGRHQPQISLVSQRPAKFIPSRFIHRN